MADSNRCNASKWIAALARPASQSGRLSANSGFTLVEVLVALSIMALIAALTWRGIDGMVRAQQATERYTDQVLTLQVALDQWRADLDAMMVWPRDLAAPAAAQHSLSWDGSVLRITRVDSADPGAGVHVVAWTRHPTDGQWLRWQSAPVRTLASWRQAWEAAARWAHGDAGAPVSVGAQAVAVASLQGWQLHYFRGNAWSNALSDASAGAAATQVLPDAVRLLITLAPDQTLGGTLKVDWLRPDFGGGHP